MILGRMAQRWLNVTRRPALGFSLAGGGATLRRLRVVALTSHLLLGAALGAGGLALGAGETPVPQTLEQTTHGGQRSLVPECGSVNASDAPGG
jgi:hypothetical protein